MWQKWNARWLSRMLRTSNLPATFKKHLTIISALWIFTNMAIILVTNYIYQLTSKGCVALPIAFLATFLCHRIIVILLKLHLKQDKSHHSLQQTIVYHYGTLANRDL